MGAIAMQLISTILVMMDVFTYFEGAYIMQQQIDDADLVLDLKEVDMAAVRFAAEKLGIDPAILSNLSEPRAEPAELEPYVAWLSDTEFALLAPHLPPGTRRNSID